MSSAPQECWDVQGGLQESLGQKAPDVLGEESGESPWSILHEESATGHRGERKVDSFFIAQPGRKCSEVGGGYKAHSKAQLACDAVEFYLEKHRFGPRLKKSLEKAVTSGPEEASRYHPEWLQPARLASKQL